MNSPAPIPIVDAIKAQIQTWRNLADVSEKCATAARAETPPKEPAAQIHDTLAYGRRSCAQQLESLLKANGL